MNKILIIVLVLIALGVGYFARGIIKNPGSISNTGGSLSASEFLGNPVVYTFTVEGVLKSKTNNSVILEKEGKQLEIAVGDNAVFAKLVNGDISATPSAFLKLDELESGSIIGAAVKEDKISSEFKLLGEQFWVK